MFQICHPYGSPHRIHAGLNPLELGLLNWVDENYAPGLRSSPSPQTLHSKPIPSKRNALMLA